MSTRNTFSLMLRNLRSMNTTLGVIAQSLTELLSLIDTLPTDEDLSAMDADINAQQVEIDAMKTQIQTILDTIKTKKK